MTDDAPEVAEDAPAEDVSSDVLYSLLADKRRRYTLHYLKQRREQVAVREVAEQVAAWENGKSVEELTSQERKRVYIALYQSHLPKLADAGVIEYNRSRGIIERTERADIFDRYLSGGRADASAPVDSDAEDEPGRAWHDYYLYAATGGALLLAGGVSGILPVSGFAVAAASIVAFGLLACAHRISDPLATDE
jgi:hypothetical protein